MHHAANYELVPVLHSNREVVNPEPYWCIPGESINLGVDADRYWLGLVGEGNISRHKIS
jgi:hypothetical protein